MRISLLEEREDFDKILKVTLEKTTFFKNRKGKIEKKYFINKYLNFIATNTLSRTVFQTLVNEYSSSLTWWKKGIQLLYVKLASSKLFRSFFAQRDILLSEDFKDYLILGGNHRIRLFYGELKDSIVILKSGENQRFIKNDIAIRTENDLSYAPEIFDSENDWLREEYFNGVPINRLKSKERIEIFIELIIKNHLEELLLPTSVEIPLKNYIQLVEKEVFELISDKKIIVKECVSSLIKKVYSKLFNKLSSTIVKTSWSHGDFQAANILVRDTHYQVIDWEASNKRFYLYDVFTLLSKIRSNIPLKEAIENLNKANTNFENAIVRNSDEIILFLIEELRFQINEEFSENFYFSGRKTEKLCHSIISYILE
ncbi:phosphotransferase [Lutimonas halocynthiae]|uniref:phosphotransferase n=1 Tax=Lutimonas halocynthiae TaxID=1446477 RepID=UPI0025B57385|nr:phosphotransferase [Lutimonas halocynthiae]MDN3643792.1 phosphotransferase [Lutimonas halocynthiae]